MLATISCFRPNPPRSWCELFDDQYPYSRLFIKGAPFPGSCSPSGCLSLVGCSCRLKEVVATLVVHHTPRSLRLDRTDPSCISFKPSALAASDTNPRSPALRIAICTPEAFGMQQHNPASGHGATPARRRPNNNPRSTHSPAAKRSYASENDMREPEGSFDYSASPSTPLKTASNTPVPRTQPTNARSKGRNGSNNHNARPKPIPNGQTTGHPGQAPSSPGPTQNRYGRTPPDAAPRSTAFAGPTFHASPAASSLPIPSFMRLDSPQVNSSRRINQEPSPPVTDSEAPTPQHPSVLPKPTVPREESPLDIFFNADRAEKEQARRASSATGFQAAPGPFSPPSFQAPSPQVSRTAPRGPQTVFSRQNLLHRTSSSGGGISTTELDGTPGRPMGPSFSTPYQDRIRAARANDRTAGPTQLANRQQQFQPGRDDNRADALKNLLGIGNASPSAARQNAMQTQNPLQSPVGRPVDTISSSPVHPQAQRLPVQHQHQHQGFFPKPTMGQASPHGNQELDDMSNRLRQILSLGQN